MSSFNNFDKMLYRSKNVQAKQEQYDIYRNTRRAYTLQTHSTPNKKQKNKNKKYVRLEANELTQLYDLSQWSILEYIERSGMIIMPIGYILRPFSRTDDLCLTHYFAYTSLRSLLSNSLEISTEIVTNMIEINVGELIFCCCGLTRSGCFDGFIFSPENYCSGKSQSNFVSQLEIMMDEKVKSEWHFRWVAALAFLRVHTYRMYSSSNFDHIPVLNSHIDNT